MTTRRDQDILDAIFNYGEIALPDRSQDDPDDLDAKMLIHPAPDEATAARLKSLEAEAVSLAETGRVDDAILKLNECVHLHESYASAYNNRAQCYRMKGENEQAAQDVENAIKYAEGDAKVLKQAYTQRAVLRRHAGDNEGAEQDMMLGAKYGNELAKSSLKNNPYAAMCNQVMREVMGIETRK
ncbi:Tetratricopeptide repeat protein 36 [Irineochytrium annulatum]|nr:Tetratricopeptide repeat protein 36 [Irineochytrium annulatum]